LVTMVKRYRVTIRRKCVHFETISNCVLSDTSCTFPSNGRLQCSSTLKHLAGHATALFGLPYAAFYSTSIQTCSALPHDAHALAGSAGPNCVFSSIGLPCFRFTHLPFFPSFFCAFLLEPALQLHRTSKCATAVFSASGEVHTP
jgi:hypothetical protein